MLLSTKSFVVVGFVFESPLVGSVCVLLFLYAQCRCTFPHPHLRFIFGGLPLGHWSTPPTQTARSTWEFTSLGGPLTNGGQVQRCTSLVPLDNS